MWLCLELLYCFCLHFSGKLYTEVYKNWRWYLSVQISFLSCFFNFKLNWRSWIIVSVIDYLVESMYFFRKCIFLFFLPDKMCSFLKMYFFLFLHLNIEIFLRENTNLSYIQLCFKILEYWGRSLFQLFYSLTSSI